MTGTVILSIKPKYAELILSGKKKIELRKRLWTENKRIKKAYLYASAPIKKIVGYIEIESAYRMNINELWMISRDASCLSKVEFDNYYSHHSRGFCIVIKVAKKFKSLVDPLVLDTMFQVPQNFCYISKELESKLNQIEVMTIG